MFIHEIISCIRIQWIPKDSSGLPRDRIFDDFMFSCIRLWDFSYELSMVSYIWECFIYEMQRSPTGSQWVPIGYSGLALPGLGRPGLARWFGVHGQGYRVYHGGLGEGASENLSQKAWSAGLGVSSKNSNSSHVSSKPPRYGFVDVAHSILVRRVS